MDRSRESSPNPRRIANRTSYEHESLPVRDSCRLGPGRRFFGSVGSGSGNCSGLASARVSSAVSENPSPRRVMQPPRVSVTAKCDRSCTPPHPGNMRLNAAGIFTAACEDSFTCTIAQVSLVRNGARLVGTLLDTAFSQNAESAAATGIIKLSA